MRPAEHTSAGRTKRPQNPVLRRVHHYEGVNDPEGHYYFELLRKIYYPERMTYKHDGGLQITAVPVSAWYRVVDEMAALNYYYSSFSYGAMSFSHVLSGLFITMPYGITAQTHLNY